MHSKHFFLVRVYFPKSKIHLNESKSLVLANKSPKRIPLLPLLIEIQQILDACMYFHHSFTCKRYVLRIVGRIYINRNIFQNLAIPVRSDLTVNPFPYFFTISKPHAYQAMHRSEQMNNQNFFATIHRSICSIVCSSSSIKFY